MKLLVVYGLKTQDRDWLCRFYPVRRLTETCANRSIPLRFLFAHEVTDFLRGAPMPVAHASGANAPASDFPTSGDFTPGDSICLVRGAVPDEPRLELERAGYRCLNSPKSSTLALDKLETARFLEAHGWPTPKTIALGPSVAAQADPYIIEPPLPCPFVVKPRFGSRGSGVALIETPGEFEVWKEQCKKPAYPDTEWIAQEFLAASKGRDLRVFFAGGEAIAAAERCGAPGDFRSNACTGGSMRAAADGPLIETWRHRALDIARESGLWYGTVDLLYRSENELAVCEINSSPGFEALERDLHLDIAGTLVDCLVRDFA